MSVFGGTSHLSNHDEPNLFVVAPESQVRAQAIEAEVVPISGQHLLGCPLHDTPSHSGMGSPDAQSMNEPGVTTVAPQHRISPLECDGRCEACLVRNNVEIPGFKGWQKHRRGE